MTLVAALPVASWGLVERLEGKARWMWTDLLKKSWLKKIQGLNDRERRTGRFRKVAVAKNISSKWICKYIHISCKCMWNITANHISIFIFNRFIQKCFKASSVILSYIFIFACSSCWHFDLPSLIDGSAIQGQQGWHFWEADVLLVCKASLLPPFKRLYWKLLHIGGRPKLSTHWVEGGWCLNPYAL